MLDKLKEAASGVDDAFWGMAPQNECIVEFAKETLGAIFQLQRRIEKLEEKVGELVKKVKK